MTLEGIARWRGDGKRPWMTPADTPDQRRWYGWDMPSIQAATSAGRSFRSNSSWSEARARRVCPRPSRSSIDFPNDHLSYALTWYGLAVVLLVVYIMFSFTTSGSEPS